MELAWATGEAACPCPCPGLDPIFSDGRLNKADEPTSIGTSYSQGGGGHALMVMKSRGP